MPGQTFCSALPTAQRTHRLPSPLLSIHTACPLRRPAHTLPALTVYSVVIFEAGSLSAEVQLADALLGHAVGSQVWLASDPT